MLNERISRFSNIGNKDGLFFVYKSLLSGVTSITSLKQFVMHHPGHIDVEVDATIMLYADLNMLVYDEENDIISLTTRDLKDLEQFINILSKKLFDFAVVKGFLILILCHMICKLIAFILTRNVSRCDMLA